MGLGENLRGSKYLRTSTPSQEDDGDPNSYGSYTFQSAFISPKSFGLYSSNLNTATLGTSSQRGREKFSAQWGSVSVSSLLSVALWNHYE